MKPDYSWLFFFIGAWLGFLAGILFYHWTTKRKQICTDKPPKKPTWCEFAFECNHTVCKSMPDECQFDNRIKDA